MFDCDWSPKRAPPLEKIFLICKKIVAWLKIDKKNVVVIQCKASSVLVNMNATNCCTMSCSDKRFKTTK